MVHLDASCGDAVVLFAVSMNRTWSALPFS